jgi:glycosyltransferase involved in cell wall biosynthesis
MNLLFITKLLPRADIIGGPILIYHRIKNLSLMGHNITLIAPAQSDKDRKDTSLKPYCDKILLIDSVKDRSEEDVDELFKKFNMKRPKFFLSGDGGYNKEIEEALRKTVKENHFDAVIAEYSMAGQYLEANQDIFPPDTLTVISVHECYTKAFELRAAKGEDISNAQIKELHDYEFTMYNAVDKILSLTREDSEILINYEPGLRKKVRIVPHGVDTEFYYPPVDKSRDENSKRMLYLGNFEHYPNVDAARNFIDHCLNHILQEVPDAKFYAIGFHPPHELLDLRSDNIIVMEGGDNENVRQLYWKSDVFVAPIELGTGFRGKILESMACGLPVVATPLATFGIDPSHGNDMFVADDYDTFARYVIRLLKDAELRKTIADNGLKLVKKFDHIYASEKLAQVFSEGKQDRS